MCLVVGEPKKDRSRCSVMREDPPIRFAPRTDHLLEDKTDNISETRKYRPRCNDQLTF